MIIVHVLVFFWDREDVDMDIRDQASPKSTEIVAKKSSCGHVLNDKFIYFFLNIGLMNIFTIPIFIHHFYTFPIYVPKSFF